MNLHMVQILRSFVKVGDKVVKKQPSIPAFPQFVLEVQEALG